MSMQVNVPIDKLINAVKEGMAVIKKAQKHPITRSWVKRGDKTLVTSTDKEVEVILHRHLKGIVGTNFLGEEGIVSGKGELTILADPLDGTRPFALGLATSTVIVAVIHPKHGVVSCVIGEPSTGRIWSATEDTPTVLWVDDFMPELARVWTSELNNQASIFLDASNGFTRNGRQIMTDNQVRQLMVNLSKEGRLSMAGSNGLHFALVANGGEYAAGQITTAIGGAWDIAGVLLVQRAGGCARGFSMQNGKLVELENPRNIMACDIMVSGNSFQTTNRLVQLLRASLQLA